MDRTRDYFDTAAKIILKYLPNAKIYLFGSRAIKKHREGADMDIAIDINEKISTSLLFAINDEIEESKIPVFVDVLDWHAVSNEMRQQIKQDGIIWTGSKENTNNLELAQLRGVDGEHEVVFEYYPIYLAFRDSLIQRFKYTSDLLWKFLKLYIEVKYKAMPEMVSPKFVIREAGSIGFLNESEVATFLDMIQHRNETSHIYKEEIAQAIANAIPVYFNLIKKIISRAKVE